MAEDRSGIIVSETKGDGRGNDRHFSSDATSGGHGGEFAPKDAALGGESETAQTNANVAINNARNLIKEKLARLRENRNAPTMANFYTHRQQYTAVRKREWGITDRQEQNSKAAAPLMKELISGCNITARIDYPDFLKVLKDGELSNQFATGHSNGAYTLLTRFQGSRKMFGHTLSDVTLGRDLEKYGCLQSKNIVSFFNDGQDASHYGNVSIIMKRKNLFDRTTYCVGDSGPGKPVLPQKLGADFDIYSCADGDDYRSMFNNFEDVRRTFELNKGTPSDFADSMAFSGYIELQLHGKVTLDDMHSIVIRMSKSRYNERNTPDQIKDMVSKCKEHGIRVLIGGSSEAKLEQINLDETGNIYYTTYESEEINDD